MKKPGWMAICLMTLSLAGSGCRYSANFHEVDPGKYYRSAQLTGEELDQAIQSLGIRTIINLRGANPKADWYMQESAVAEKHGVRLVSIGMGARRIPHRANLIALLDAFRDSERPLLVHCLQGADRTGEATALYMMEYMAKSKENALQALRLRYHHVEAFAPAKRYFIGLYQGLDWAYHIYDPCVQDYKYYDRAACRSQLIDAEEEDEELSPEEVTRLSAVGAL